jgi:hypothetical protein
MLKLEISTPERILDSLLLLTLLGLDSDWFRFHGIFYTQKDGAVSIKNIFIFNPFW